jgi:hypothetical protein
LGIFFADIIGARVTEEKDSTEDMLTPHIEPEPNQTHKKHGSFHHNVKQYDKITAAKTISCLSFCSFVSNVENLEPIHRCIVVLLFFTAIYRT